jgi:hypothetical protein
VRGTLRRQSVRNRLQNTVDILEYLVVPKSQYTIILASEPLVTYRISFADAVLPAIEFDDQSLLTAYEVDDVSADWFLTDEFVARNLPRANSIPETQLSIGRIRP